MTKLQHERTSASPVASHNLKRNFLRAIQLASVLVPASLVAMPNQDALAIPLYGDCSGFGSVPYVGVPYGQTCTSVKGKGLDVHSIYAEFQTVNPICNWRYDIVLSDVNGRAYNTKHSPVHSGCSAVGSWTASYGRNGRYYSKARQGQACAVLYQNGSKVDAACSSIFP